MTKQDYFNILYDPMFLFLFSFLFQTLWMLITLTVSNRRRALYLAPLILIIGIIPIGIVILTIPFGMYFFVKLLSWGILSAGIGGILAAVLNKINKKSAYITLLSAGLILLISTGFVFQEKRNHMIYDELEQFVQKSVQDSFHQPAIIVKTSEEEREYIVQAYPQEQPKKVITYRFTKGKHIIGSNLIAVKTGFNAVEESKRLEKSLGPVVAQHFDHYVDNQYFTPICSDEYCYISLKLIHNQGTFVEGQEKKDMAWLMDFIEEHKIEKLVQIVMGVRDSKTKGYQEVVLCIKEPEQVKNFFHSKEVISKNCDLTKLAK
jgi:hypothetical protein